MRTLSFILILSACLFAERSNDFYVTKTYEGYLLSWDEDVQSTITRGDLNTDLLVFVDTVIYNGSGNTFLDTVGDSKTKYYVLTRNGSRIKIDTNKFDMYDLVIDNMLSIKDLDQNCIINEVRIAQFGKGAILRWKNSKEPFYIKLNRSGTIESDINVYNKDDDLWANYYIIDNLNNLTSIKVYELNITQTEALFELSFKAPEPNTNTNNIIIVAGASTTIINGDQNQTNIDSINVSTTEINTDYSETQKNSLLGDSGANGSGGGCFLK